MDPDSTAGTSDCRSVSDKFGNVGDDYISKLLGFEDNSTEVANSSDANKMSDDQLKKNHDLVTPEGPSRLQVMNGHSHKPNNDSLDENEDLNHNEMDHGFNLAKKLKELMQIKREADKLHEKWELSEKEKNELQLQVDLLQAENHQFKHLKNLKEENSQKVNELQKDLAIKLKAQLKLRNEIEGCNLKISEKNDAIKKMKRDNKSLWNMVTRFARKLADADLLTPKEKNTVKKYGEENHISVDTFDSEEQGEEKDLSLTQKIELSTDMKQNTDSVENGNRPAESVDNLPTNAKESGTKNSEVKNDGFQFNQSRTSLPKPKLSSGSNYFMKSCRDVIEDPHVSDDCLDITVNELKEMRRQLSASNDHFSPISPLPPTPPPSGNRFKCGMSRRALLADNPVLTVPVRKSPGQTSNLSKSHGLLSVDPSVPSSSRKLTFCHQQSEGFDVPTEQHNLQRFSSDKGHANHRVANINSQTNSSPAPYQLSAKRCHDGTVKLNFHINNPISISVNPNNWEVSCILGQDEQEDSNTPFTLQAPVETTNAQTYDSFSNNLMTSADEPTCTVMNKISKVEPSSNPELITSVLDNSEQSSFVSVGKSNVSKSKILNQDISVNTNTFGHFSKEAALEKGLPLGHPHSVNCIKVSDPFAHPHRNTENNLHFENHTDDNRSVVSSSCESPSPYRKKNEMFSKEFSSPSPAISEMKSRKLDKLSNVPKMCSLSEINCALEYNSTGSESELIDKSKLTKLNSEKCGPVKKRRKSSVMVPGESSTIVPARNKGRTLLSRAFGSTRNSISTNANLEAKKSESNDENKTPTTVKLNEKHLLSHGQVEETIEFNSSDDKKDPSNCIKLSNNAVEENEDECEQMETEYKNVNSRKRVSRIKTRKSKTNSVNHPAIVKQKNVSVISKSPKKKSEMRGKVELERMAALKSTAAEWAAQRKKGEINKKNIVSEESFDSNLFTVSNSLDENNAEKSIDVTPTKTEAEHKQKISDIAEVKPKQINFSTDSVKIAVELCAKIDSKDVAVKVINDTLLNVPSTDHFTNDKIEKNLEKSNIFIPDTTVCSISKDNRLEGCVNALEVDSTLNDNVPILVSNNCSISARTDFPNNQVSEQKINTNISDDDNLIKNVESTEIQNTGLFRSSSLLENHNLPMNEVHKSATQKGDNFHDIAKSSSSPILNSPKSSSLKMKSPKSSSPKIKSPKSFAAKVKYSDELNDLAKSSEFNSFANINNSEFPEVSLPPLPLDPFGLSEDKSNTFSLTETSIESPIPSSLVESTKLSISNNEKLSKLPFQSENKNGTETLNVAKTKQMGLFNQEEFTNESFIDFLVKEEDELEDCGIKGISDTGIKEKLSNTRAADNSSCKTKVDESQTSSNPISGNIESAAPNASQLVCDIIPSKAISLEPASNVYSNLDMIIDSVAVGDIEVEVETQDPSDTTYTKTPVVNSSPHVEKRKGKGNLKSINLSIAKESTLSGGDNKPINNQISDADSNISGIEIEVKTQDPSPRTCRKRQSSVVDSSHHAEKRKMKGNLKSIDLSIAKESSLSYSDTKHMNGQVSEADSDNESPLVIAEDFEEVQPSIPLSKVKNSEVNVVDSIDKSTANKKQKIISKSAKKIEVKGEPQDIEAAFQAIDKMRFTETHFRLHVHSLMTSFINPTLLENTPKLVFHLVKYLHITRKNPMLSFSLSNDPDILLPTSEQCIVKALLAAKAKNKPHLGDLLTYVVETLYLLILGKAQYHIYGLSSLCRVMTAICKELNEPTKPRQLCCDLLKYNHKFAPFLIASIVGVYREAFEVLPDTTEEEKIFLSSLSYGVQQKPKTITETQWKHCNNIFSRYLIVEFLTNVSEPLPYLMSAIEDKCMFAPYENEYMLMGPLVIYARVKGWAWALEHLLEDYVLPNLQAYSNKENGERGFSFFTNLCADICYGCPDEELSRSCLMRYWKGPSEREFVSVHAGAALLKLILLRKELFPDEMQEWIPYYHEDPRVESSKIYFKLRLMEDNELNLESDIF